MRRLFRRRPPEPERCEYDCRHLDAYRHAADRARAIAARLREMTSERDSWQTAAQERAAELADAHTQRIFARQGREHEAFRVVQEAERRATAATQRAGLAEQRAARLEELLARAEGRPYDSRRVDAPGEPITEGVA